MNKWETDEIMQDTNSIEAFINEKIVEARKLFHEGFNCAQAVSGAFSEECGLNNSQLFKAASSFGGGIGRLREVCGAVSGICLIAGLLYGNSRPDPVAKSTHYKRIQDLVERFREENGAIVCRELLHLKDRKETSEASVRTEDWYRKRPCSLLVESATRILAETITESK